MENNGPVAENKYPTLKQVAIDCGEDSENCPALPGELDEKSLMKLNKKELEFLCFHRDLNLNTADGEPDFENLTKAQTTQIILSLHSQKREATEPEYVPIPEVYYRFRKLDRIEWELIQYRDGVETVIVRDILPICHSKFERIIITQQAGE